MEQELAKLIIWDWLMLAFLLIGSNMLKDVFTELSLGMTFYFDKVFNEGDFIYMDGEQAIIIKIGMRYSVFEVTKVDGTVTWKYIRNSLVKRISLERVMEHKS
ncbi:mechanosensitive channel [Paraglaciecola Antarctic GD virus 1]|nr:mechanosensitive channel [Paraglaciecola Antarctic GD virus 1]